MPTHERLIHVAPPRARLAPVDVQLPLLPDGVKVERFTTAYRVIFEKHTTAAGVETWYKVQNDTR